MIPMFKACVIFTRREAVRRVGLATLHAWAAAAVSLWAFFAWHGWQSNRPLDLGPEVIAVCLIIDVSILVLPTFLLIVGPLVSFLPRPYLLGNPIGATFTGAATGLVAMYLWAAACSTKWFVPNLSDPLQIILGGSAMFSGIAFFISYGRSVKNNLLWKTFALASLFLCTTGASGWEAMWTTAIAIYAGFKWKMWREAVRTGVRADRLRTFKFLVLWPGMDARRFLDDSLRPEKPARAARISGEVNMAFGAGLVWGVAHTAGDGMLAGWIGMIGLIFLLHFGLFKLLALFWQANGICAQPLMRMPVAAKSVGDFWGNRWNVAFRDISFGLMFRGFRKRHGAHTATMLTFFASGIIHDAVISLPAGGGYGLPTAYFTLQGAAMLFEHTRAAAKLGLRGGLGGRLFAWAVIAGPAYWLFPPPFVLNVIVPFLRAIKAL